MPFKTMIEIIKELKEQNPEMNKFTLMDQARKIYKEQQNASSS